MRYRAYLLVALDWFLTIVAPMAGLILVNNLIRPLLAFNPADISPLHSIALVGAHAVSFLIVNSALLIVWVFGQLLLCKLYLKWSSDVEMPKLPMVPEAIYRKLNSKANEKY